MEAGESEMWGVESLAGQEMVRCHADNLGLLKETRNGAMHGNNSVAGVPRIRIEA